MDRNAAIRVLRLISPDARLLQAALADPPALRDALDCRLAEGWAVFPEALRRTRDLVAADPASVRWGPRLFVVPGDPALLAGWGGFKGPPGDGVVEIRYAIAPALRGRGIATAAADGLVRGAFLDPAVAVVVARTDPAPNPSARVLAKARFLLEGEFPDEEIGRAWRFRRERGQTR